MKVIAQLHMPFFKSMNVLISPLVQIRHHVVTFQFLCLTPKQNFVQGDVVNETRLLVKALDG